MSRHVTGRRRLEEAGERAREVEGERSGVPKSSPSSQMEKSQQLKRTQGESPGDGTKKTGNRRLGAHLREREG